MPSNSTIQEQNEVSSENLPDERPKLPGFVGLLLIITGIFAIVSLFLLIRTLFEGDGYDPGAPEIALTVGGIPCFLSVVYLALWQVDKQVLERKARRGP